jgi:regulator of replication initiation timing
MREGREEWGRVRWEGERELERERERVGRLLEHNRNLEIENRLVLEIKQKYSADLAQLRAEKEELRRENAKLRGENEKLRKELGSLASELAQLEKDFYSPRQPSLQQLPTAATLQSSSSL